MSYWLAGFRLMYDLTESGCVEFLRERSLNVVAISTETCNREQRVYAGKKLGAAMRF